MIGHHRRMERREERREHRHGHTPPPPMMPVPVPPAPEPVPRAAGAAPCKYSHCTAAATFGFADEPGAPLYCITHKSDEMIALVVAPPPAAVAPPAAAAKTCEFARCTAPATHGFADEGIARFCCAHSAVDNTMIEIAGVAPSVAAAAAGKAGSTMQPSPAFEGNAGAVSPATASLLKEYDAAGAREKELAQLTTGADANARHQAEVGNKVKALEHEVASLALAISETQEHLERQNHKPSLGGRSMFGKGLFVRDEEKVAALTKELEEQRARHHAAKAELQQACSKLEVLQVEGAKLASLDSEKRQLHERRSHIHNKVRRRGRWRWNSRRSAAIWAPSSWRAPASASCRPAATSECTNSCKYILIGNLASLGRSFSRQLSDDTHFEAAHPNRLLACMLCICFCVLLRPLPSLLSCARSDFRYFPTFCFGRPTHSLWHSVGCRRRRRARRGRVPKSSRRSSPRCERTQTKSLYADLAHDLRKRSASLNLSDLKSLARCLWVFSLPARRFPSHPCTFLCRHLLSLPLKIPTELYTKYPSQMAGVGRGVEVPKLWEGRFGRDVMVGAVFGDVGDGVNQLRAARGVRENQEQIARCDRIAEEQQRRLAAVAAGLQAEQAALDRQ
ncbi:unnamed protein product, partial [Phaeothamnion confervicola]